MNMFEAFKSFTSLNEEVFNLDDDGINDAGELLDDTEEDVVDVIDPNATTVEELEDGYVGKGILDCNVCHSLIYKNMDDIVEKDGVFNAGEECPYCMATDGYTAVGKVVPFDAEADMVDTEAAADNDELEINLDDIDDIDEDDFLNESMQEINVKTDNDTISIKDNAEGGVTIQTNPGDSMPSFEDEDEDEDDEEFGKSEDEMIVPLDSGDEAEFETADEVSEGPIADETPEEPIAEEPDEEESDEEEIEPEDMEVEMAESLMEKKEKNKKKKDKKLSPEEQAAAAKRDAAIDRIGALLNVDDSYDESLMEKKNKNKAKKPYINKNAGDLSRLASLLGESDTEDDCNTFEVDEVDETTLDPMVESYFKSKLPSVRSYSTTQIKETGKNSLIIEGVITRKNNSKHKIVFQANAREIQNPNDFKLDLITESLKTKHNITINGKIKNTKLITESYTAHSN